MKFFKSGSKGFTLIELLVVIAILGTLAAVVILNVTKFIGSGRTESQQTERHNVQTAVVAWMYDNPSSGTLTETVTAGSTGGSLAPYLLTSLNCTYVITSGSVGEPSGCLK